MQQKRVRTQHSLKKQRETLCKLSSFITTFDMWTSLSGSHYLVITYTGIIPDDTFAPWSAVLDLVAFSSRAFGSVISAVSKRRIEINTTGKRTILHAGNVSDSGSNVHLAGLLLTTENDQEDCFNHKLHLCIADVSEVMV